MVLQVALQSIFAIVVYQFIVKRRHSAATYLLGYGVIIPLAMNIPYYLLEFLDIQNKTVRLSLSTFPTVVCFRTIEAMHNTSPPVVETSLNTYLQYYSSLFHFSWNPKTKKPDPISLTELAAIFLRIIAYFHLVSIVLSLLVHYDFQPFPSNVVLDSFHLSFDIFHPGHLANTYLLAGKTMPASFNIRYLSTKVLTFILALFPGINFLSLHSLDVSRFEHRLSN